MSEDDIVQIANWMLTVPLWQRYGLKRENIISQFQKAISIDDLLVVVELEDTKIIAGFAWCVIRGAFDRSPYLKQIGIHPDYTSMGLGAELIQHIETESQEYADQLFLLVSDFNKSAQKFYERQGYQQIGTIPDYVLTGVSELIYYKRLIDRKE